MTPSEHLGMSLYHSLSGLVDEFGLREVRWVLNSISAEQREGKFDELDET